MKKKKDNPEIKLITEDVEKAAKSRATDSTLIVLFQIRGGICENQDN